MFPVVNVAKRAISTYDILVVIAFAVAVTVSVINLKRRGVCIKKMCFAFIAAMVGSTLGGHLLYGFTNTEAWSFLFANATQMTFIEIAKVLWKIFDGLLFQGLILGGFVGLKAYSVFQEKAVNTLLSDLYAVCVPLALAIGKVGCFLNGCCYGIEFKLGLSIKNPEIAKIATGRRLPVALLEAYFYLLLFLLLYSLFKNGKFGGRAFCIFLLFNSPISFGIQYLRGDSANVKWGMFAPVQWVGIALFGIALLCLVIGFKRTIADIKHKPENLPTDKNLLKFILINLVTFGVYSLVVKGRIVKEINFTTKYSQEKKTMNFWLMFFVVGFFTLGVAWIVWYHRLSAKISRELIRRNIDYLFTVGDFWLWNIAGWLVLIGPLVYMHKLMRASNLINADYNKQKSKETV